MSSAPCCTTLGQSLNLVLFHPPRPTSYGCWEIWRMLSDSRSPCERLAEDSQALLVLQPMHFCHFEEPQSWVEFIRDKRLNVAPSITERQRVQKTYRCSLCSDTIVSLSLPLSFCYIFFSCILYQFGGFTLVLYVGVSLTKVISYIVIVNILKCIFLTLRV